MESFYGGRQGASFVIKGSFKFITDKRLDNGDYVDEYYGQAYDEYEHWGEPGRVNPSGYKNAEEWLAALDKATMTKQLNKSNYKDVWYGEYCIIDPDNKNNKNNGKIFRRTLKGAGDENLEGECAEYIGQIVGPAGPTPQLKDITGVDATEANFQELVLDLDDEVRFWNAIKDENGNVVDREWDESKNTEDSLYVHSLGNKIKMLPGSTKRTNYTSHPEYFKQGNSNATYLQQGGYNWYDVRINNSTDDISQIYIGFDFPYYVTKFEAGDVLPDVSPIETVRTINTIAKPFGTAPFYEKYKINIPRGLRGAWFEDIRSVVRVSNTTYYTVDAINYQEPGYKNINGDDLGDIPKMDTTYPSSPTHYQEDGFFLNTNTTVSTSVWPVGAKGWVATFCWRTKDKQSLVNNENSVVHKVENVFLGLDRYIENIVFDDDGTLVFKYSAWTSDNTSAAYTNRASQIGDTSNGTAASRYNTWFKKIDWIKKIDINSPTFNKGVKKADIDTDDATVNEGSVLSVTFNNKTVNFDGNEEKTSDTYSKNLRTIAGIKMFDEGSVRFYRSDGTRDDFREQINWIKSANVTPMDADSKTGDTLNINFNNGNIKNISKNLRLITGMTLADDGVLTVNHSDGSVRASNGNDDAINLGPAISWVKEVYRLTSNDSATYNADGTRVPPHHLLIRFNNTTPGETTELSSVTYNGKTDWFDLGVVQEILDGLYFNDSAVEVVYQPGTKASKGFSNAIDQAIHYLNTDSKWKNGTPDIEGRHLGQKALVGTLVTKNDNGEVIVTDTCVFYYDNGEDSGQGAGWKLLGTLSSSQSSVVLEDSTLIPASSAVIFTVQEVISNSKLLDEPWRP